MKELIEKMIALLEEYKDKSYEGFCEENCETCKDRWWQDWVPNKYFHIYKIYNQYTVEPVEWNWDFWIYKVVKNMNWFGINGRWFLAATPSYWWLTIFMCKQDFNPNDNKYYRKNEILFEFSDNELKGLIKKD